MGLSSAVVVGYFERHPAGRDRLDRLVVNGFLIGSATLEAKIDRAEFERDRQRLGQTMDRPRKLGTNAVTQQFRDLIGRTRHPVSLSRGEELARQAKH